MHVSGFEFDRSLTLEGRQAQPTGGGASADHANSSRVRAEGGYAHDVDADVADLSPAALAAANKTHGASSDAPDKQGVLDESGPAQSGEAAEDSGAGAERKTDGQPLTKDEQKQVQELKDRDRETRAHEQAHKSAAGPYAQGGPVFVYQQGPDGRRYAVGGHVSIDTSEVSGDPQATIQKMQVVRRAALAPSDPSDQDRKVAAQAAQAEQKARAELRESRDDQNTSTDDRDSGTRRSAGGRGLLVDVTA